MNTDNIIHTLDKFDLFFTEYKTLVEKNIKSLNSDVRDEIDNLLIRTELQIASRTVTLIRVTNVYIFSFAYHMARAEFHASPGLTAIIAGIVTVVEVVIKIVKAILNSRVMKIVLALHKITKLLLPAYRESVEQFLRFVSSVSKQLGMGVDGVMHLVNAAGGVVGLISGIKGEYRNEFEGVFYERYKANAQFLALNLKKLSEDPSKAMADIFLYGKFGEYWEGRNWWEKTSDWIESALTEATKVAESVGYITGELVALEATLPKFIRDNIPKNLWDKVFAAERFISIEVLPFMSEVNSQFNEVNAVLNAHRARVDSLGRLLRKPGDVLLGIDDLPAWAQQNQLDMIDDVTSRQFEMTATAERLDMMDDLDEFDRVDKALEAPTPQPPFMSIEDAGYITAPEIVKEPHETWFVGDY